MKIHSSPLVPSTPSNNYGPSINTSKDPANSKMDLIFTFSKTTSNPSGKIKTIKKVVPSFSDSKDQNPTDFGKTFFSLLPSHQKNKSPTFQAWESKSVKKMQKLTSGLATRPQPHFKNAETGFWKKLILTVHYHWSSFNSSRNNEWNENKKISFIILIVRFSLKKVVNEIFSWFAIDLLNYQILF